MFFLLYQNNSENIFEKSGEKLSLTKVGKINLTTNCRS
jgi:hypothetical protein